MSKATRSPNPPTQVDPKVLQAADLLKNAPGAIDDTYAGATAKETSRDGNFDPKDYEYANADSSNYYDNKEDLAAINVNKQGYSDVAWRSGKQFLANTVSAFGQGIANTFDLVSAAHTAKAEITGDKDDFRSSIFGLTTEDMQNWSNNVAKNNQIYEREDGSFNPFDLGWWGKQVASSGTGIGMGLEALAETAAIEYSTGGLGTGAAIAKLGSLGKRILQGARGAEMLTEALSAAKGLRSAATLYGVLSRVSESRSEAMNTYDMITQELSGKKNPDGSDKFTKDQVEQMASEGSRRDFNGNLALLPLDILSYRLMTFNPISGAGEGFLEKAFSKIGNKALKFVTQYGVDAALEGSEEGFQQIAQNEGQQYARVLGGTDDGSTFMQRVGKDVQDADFWNNFAGGVVGSPIIGGVMKLVNRVQTGNRQAKLEQMHKDYIKNIGMLSDKFGTDISNLESQGKHEEASLSRRQYQALKVLGAIHLDAMTDKESAFEAHKSFVEGTLGELNEGKTTALNDLGFSNLAPEHLEQIKKEFETYAQDADDMKRIYDEVKDKYNKSVVPEVTFNHFQLENLLQGQKETEAKITDAQTKLSQFDQLSQQGQQIYNSEYQLKALNSELDRLTELHRNTESVHDKQDISAQMEQVKANITKTTDNLKTVQEGENYNQEDKQKDNDIINSALRSREYQQAINDKTRLENEVSLKRKQIARWNNKEYIAERNKAAINNAKTDVQLQATKQNINNGENQEDTKAAINSKEAELAANRAAQVIQENGQEKKDSNAVPGNSNLFGDDQSNAIIGDLKATAYNAGINHAANVKPDTGIDGNGESSPPAEVEVGMLNGEAEDILSPAEYDFDKSSDEAKAKIKAGVGGLISRLGDNGSFKDLVKEVIKSQGIDTADQIYNALRHGWEANGKEAVDYNAVYNEIFNPVGQLMAGVAALTPKTPAQAAKEVQQIEQKDLLKQGTPQGFDQNNQPVYVYKGEQGTTYVTNESSPKFAFVSRLAEITQTTNDDGTISVESEYTDDNINAGQYVDSTQLLDPDKWTEGTEAEVRVPSNYNDLLVPVYNADGTKGKAIPFGRYVAENNLSLEDQEYKDKLPMIIYRKGAPENEKGVAFVHDVHWYNSLKFNQNVEFKEDREKAIANTRGIREGVIKGNNKADIVITGKRQTTFDGFKTKDKELITLREANPQTKLTVARSTDSVEVAKQVPFVNDKRALINKSPFTIGNVYDVRRFGNKDGKETHVALPVTDARLDNEGMESVKQAIAVYANRTNTDKATRDKHDAIAKHISSTMGMDIKSNQGIEQYLKHFIATFNVDKAKTNADVEAQAKAKFPTGTPYIAFIAGGNIVFGQAGIKQTTNISSYFINPNSAKNDAGLKALTTKSITVGGKTYPSFLHWYKQNVGQDALTNNKPIVSIDKDGNTKQSADSYNDYLLDRLKTNVKSVNIGTKDKPNYVTNLQPVITYDLKANLAAKAPSNEQVKQEVISNSQPESLSQQQQVESGEQAGHSEKTQEAKTATDIEKEVLDRARSILGNSIRLDDDELYDPAEMTEEQRKEAAKDITRIAGLTPDEQADIVNFMYNQIVPLVDNKAGRISKAEADKQVEKAYSDVVEEVKKNYQEELDRNKALLQQFPNLQNSDVPKVIRVLENQIAKINSVKDNLNTLKGIAFAKVEKYTGIQSSKEQVEAPVHEDDEQEGTEEENSRDFWTDILTESPDSRLSYAMRRFFGQIRSRDKNGNAVNGFLGLPKYEDATEVSMKLMVTLADVPSDFDTMMKELEERKGSIPWMDEVINRLKGSDKQRKNQFVTVMSNHSLRMKFTMLSFNKKTSTWTAKVYNTNQSGVADAINTQWNDNLKASDLVLGNQDGTYSLNIERAKHLISQFEGWKGIGLSKLSDPKLMEGIRANIKTDSPVTFTPSVGSTLAKELEEKLRNNSDRIGFSLKGFNYQITKVGNSYRAEFLKSSTATDEQLKNWLANFGIDLHDQTFTELKAKGLYHNQRQVSFNNLFDIKIDTNSNSITGSASDGLFAILYNKIKTIVDKGGAVFEEEGNSPLEDSVIKSLAKLESKYNDKATPFGFRDGKKTIYALTAPKFITDRVRDLKDGDSQIRMQLQGTSFNRHSFWLTLLNDADFRNDFSVSHIGLTAFKQMGKKNYRDNSITKLSDLDHELTKLGMFWDTTQGQVRYKDGDKSFTTYPGTSIGLRMGTMFSPTMSDKDMMTLMTTAVLDLQAKDLSNGKEGQYISREVSDVLYTQLVKPELERMVNFYGKKINSTNNIKDYEKGAGMFFMMPKMNELMYNDELKLTDAIKHKPDVFTVNFIESNKDIMDSIRQNLNEYIKSLVTEKIQSWKDSKMVNQDDSFAFIDSKYADRLHGTNTQKLQQAASDYVVNNLVSNANSFMTMAGDPALYFKSKSKEYMKIAEDTFTNVGKRLAAQIAPGTTLANSEGEKYLQLFLKDRESVVNNIEYLESILGKEGAKPYRKVEGSDAQEYTTWKEHLSILEKMGKLGDGLTDISPDEINEARALLSSGVDKSKLTERQRELLGKVAQPIKPVYTGQLHDPEQDVMRTVYIKSSSFPLIPQLTAGMEIDKLRQAMEKMEADQKMNVRASYQTANKVGAMNNPINIWKEDGTMNEEELAKAKDASMILDRKNFRIQQDVPFKTGKNSEDKISLGTQIMKLLFGDGIMNIDGFEYNGKKVSGKELQQLYNNHFIALTQEKRQQLFAELALDKNGQPVDAKKSMARLQQILRDEASNRGYPLQDIQALTLNEQGEFNLPLWSSANSNRYESMLNSIVGNRIVKQKFPGNSYVVGSEEGFRTTDNLKDIDQSKVIWTSAWNGKELQGTRHENGELKKAQVLVASKFRDRDGNLIDLFEKEGGEYKYITKTDAGFKLREEKFDKELLGLTSFRVPTSGHQSASQIEIAGFLPYVAADLMIVPKGFTKQKGLDFDVDKENGYQLHHWQDDEGNFRVLGEDHKDAYLLHADKQMRDILSGNKADDNLLKQVFGGVKYTQEDIEKEKFLSKRASQFKEKLLQNEIIKIHRSVLSHPSNEVQAKINKVLSTDFAEQQADFIENLSPSGNNPYWTPLSDEYQKYKMGLGASGKIGTGAYSLDVVFHSLAQQSALNGHPIKLTKAIKNDAGKIIGFEPMSWRFGKVTSNEELGASKTVDGSRSISDVMTERQNIAVDNEKLQVMGRVGLNDSTLDVDKVFNLVGIDKGEDGNSIPFLFLSQPIIKDYVAMMKNASSNVAEYDAQAEEKIIKELFTKYGVDVMGEANEEAISDQMTNANFSKAIKDNGKDGNLQAAVLNRFLEMKKYGLAIRGIQSAINTDSKGLGKSFFDVIEKRNAINRLGRDSELVGNARHLFGDFEPVEGLSTEGMTALLEQGYVYMGEHLIKPTTLSGAFGVHAVSTAYDLWSKHFPYDAAMTSKVFDEVLSIIGSETMGDTKAVELKQQIFQGIKKYSSASKKNGIIQSTDDINEERKRLFIDSEDNTSLASYIKGLMNTTGNKAVDTFIKTNKLLNRLEFKIQKNGEPSLLKYNNAGGEDFDEQYLYESLASLMEVRGKDGRIELPQIGNKKYTLDKLAQDLVAYCYLGNSIQEAIQFTKYVPVGYLNSMGYSAKMRDVGKHLSYNNKVLGIKMNSDSNKHLVSNFTMQYIQHNPERVKYKLDGNKINKTTVGQEYSGETKSLSNLKSFYLKGNDNPSFISIYNASIPKGEKKFQLYWTSDGKKYTKINTLGAFGMDEYQPGTDIGTSLVNGRVRTDINPQEVIQGDTNQGGESQVPFNADKGKAKPILESIIQSESTPYTELAKRLIDFVGDTSVELKDLPSFGKFVPESNSIFIANKILGNANQVANTAIHEVIHSLTYHQVNKYITTDDKGTVHVNEGAPTYISNLVRMYNRLRNNVDQVKLGEVIAAAREKGALSTADKTNYYGYTSIHEFMTMSLTNKEFQDQLNKIPYGDGQSFLDKFKAFVAQVLQAVGLNFDDKYTAAHAISTIFETIESENPRIKDDFDPDTFYDFGANHDNFEDFLGEQHQMDIGTFPVKSLSINSEKCL